MPMKLGGGGAFPTADSCAPVIVGSAWEPDIDFLIRTTPSTAHRVLDVLNAFGFGTLGIAERDLLEPGRIVQLGHPPNRIEFRLHFGSRFRRGLGRAFADSDG